MYIVAIEGLDKSGKHTQTMELKNHLTSLGYRVETDSYHQYDSPTGKLIRDFLDGKYEVSVETISLLIAADKHAQQERYKKMKEDGEVDYLLIDRYVGSQIVFMLVQGMDEDYVEHLQKNLLQPDMEFLLDVSVETSMSRKGKHGANDVYERNKELLTEVRQGFLDYFLDKPVLNVEGKSVEQVHSELIDLFKEEMRFIEEAY